MQSVRIVNEMPEQFALIRVCANSITLCADLQLHTIVVSTERDRDRDR